MKPPGWLVPVGKPYRKDGELVQDWHVRLWHPGLWLELVRRRMGR